MSEVNQFQRFERLLKKAYILNSECFNYENTKRKIATKNDIGAEQEIIDYSINKDKLMALTDDKIVEAIGNHIKYSISKGFDIDESTQTLEYTSEYHTNLLKNGKNTFNRKAMFEVECGENVIYVQPYVHEVEEITKSEIIKTKFRFVTICIHQ